MTVTEARAALPEVLDRVTAGEEVIITRHGRPVAVVVRPDVLRSRRAGPVAAHVSRVEDLLDSARRTPDLPVPGLTAERADELVAEIHAGRRR